MSRKTIVVDARMINNSGIGVYIEHLVRGLIVSEKYIIVLIGNKSEIESKISLDIFYKIVDVKLPIYSLKEQFYLPFIIPKCDIFWSPHYNVPLLPIFAKRRIVTIHDTYHLAFSETLSLIEFLYAKVLLNCAVRLSNRVFTDSSFSKNEIVKFTKCVANKIDIIYVGVDNNKFNVVANERIKANVVEKLLLPDKFLLFVGNVKPNKNLVRLLEAFLVMIKDHSNIKLVIVGKREGFITGDERVHKLLEKNQQLKTHVHFTGYVATSDLPIIYNLATLLVFPSIYEGFGLPPLEAMACGCPVVVSSAASIPEVCGNAGQYVDPFKISSIKEGISLVMSNEKLRLNLIELGMVRVRKFNWSVSLNKIISIFDVI